MAKQQIGLKLAPDLVAAVDAEAKAQGITRTEAFEAALAIWLDGPAGSEVLASLPKPKAVSARSGKAKASAPAPSAGPQVRPGRSATPSAPPPAGGGVRVSTIDLPFGRERPAYGALVKGGGRKR